MPKRAPLWLDALYTAYLEKSQSWFTINIWLWKESVSGGLTEVLLEPFFTALTTFSGINDYDYPSLSSPSVGLAGMELVSLLKRVPLPAELVEQFNCILWVLLLFVINEVMRELQLCKQVHWTVCGLEFIYYKQSKTKYVD